MIKKVFVVLSLLFLFGLSGCGKKVTLDEYDIEGIIGIGYPVEMGDMAFEDQELLAESEKLFSSMSENILLSYVVDSAIYIEEELGEYDHLVMVNPRWMERFAEPDKLRPVEYDSLSESMRAFLEVQMPMLTVDGSILPDGLGLYEYDGGELFVLPQYAAEGYADPLEAKNPLIILVDNPEETLKAKGCLVPLTSTGNLLFTDGEKLLELIEESELNNYVLTYIIEEKNGERSVKEVEVMIIPLQNKRDSIYGVCITLRYKRQKGTKQAKFLACLVPLLHISAGGASLPPGQ